ncbi:hypothetical protein WSM22_46940 [Cytophagales bacterium WSM2-2]|nr:hypothetical protein WSM22_46940 [Cytophagales bacterium WSM2-2]
MKKVLMISSIFALSACVSWPDEWSNDYEIDVRQYGGSLPESWQMQIKGDSAIYKNIHMGKEEVVRFTPKRNELNSLAQIIKNAHPEEIHMKQHAVTYDKSTAFMRIRYKNHSIELEESANKSISNRERFNLIYDFVAAMRPKKND